MAIEQSFTTAHGLTASKAYWRIYKIEYNVLKSVSTVAYVKIYKDAAARTSNKIPVDTLKFDFSISTQSDAKELVTQAYASLKQQSKVKDDRGKDLSIDLSKAKDV